MNIVYKITYLPHLNTDLPKYYIGSKFNYKGNYFGSIASKQIFDYTNGKSLKHWWKTRNRDEFVFQILAEYDNISPTDLVLKEREVQKELGIESSDYFNQAFAAKGFCSKIKSEATKIQMSLSMSNFWNTEAGLQKRERLRQRNKQTKSQECYDRYKDPEFKARVVSKLLDTVERNKKQIEYEGNLYSGWKSFTSQTGISRYRYLQHYKSKP